MTDANRPGETCTSMEIESGDPQTGAPTPNPNKEDEPPVKDNERNTEEEVKSPELKKRKVTESKSEESASEESINDIKNTKSGNPIKTSEKDDSSAESDLNIPTIDESLGKGKRARIPNKRYSDIILSPSRPTKIQVENGENKIEMKLELENDDEEMTSFQSASSTKSRSNTSSPIAKRQKVIDPGDPKFLKPFEQGWRRELVYRAASENMVKRGGDVYYYTPSGKKVRSMREISENLKNTDLTLDNFLFLREPIGLNDPEKEIIRDAKVWSKKGATNKTTAKGTEMPQKSRTSARNLIKVKLPPSRSSKGKKPDEELSEIEAPNTRKSTSKKAPLKITSSVEMENKPCQPCSIRCRGVMGMVPTLQCRLCLCLYHYECVGLSPHIQIQSYVCKNCQIEHGQTVSTSSSIVLPPLTPINTLKSITSQSSALPILQRIPRESESPGSDVGAAVSMPRLLPIPKPGKDVPQAKTPEAKSIVGSVTSWLPHSSTIQVEHRNKENEPVEAPRPQYVEYLAGRKFLIIPKHNVVSVSPTVVNKRHLLNWDVGQSQERKSIEKSPNEVVEREAGDEVLGQDANETIPEQSKSRQQSIDNNVQEYREESKFMDSYLQNLCFGYNTLLHVFQYLKVQDLLRASCVCTMWRDIASHSSLWRTVRMKNSQVHSFQGLANSLHKHGTVHLDLRKMLLFPYETKEIWAEFSPAIEKVQTLRKIEFGRCPSSVIEKLPATNKNLEVINAVAIRGDSISIHTLSLLENLKELRLKSPSGLTLNSSVDALIKLTQLTHLTLTSIKDLHKQDLSVLTALTNLESLDIGECVDFAEEFGGEILTKLQKLEKLRLEKGQGTCHTFEILMSLKDMPQLEQLELVNFDIKVGFDMALGMCTNIKKLLVIPTYISQSATTNHMVLGGVLRLQSTLSHFVWGVTLELLRVTELFVDQSEDPEKRKERKLQGGLDSIPVLKPVPLITEKDDIPPAHDPPQVEIIPLANLQKLLLQSLPTTKVKILKIPFHATWRQSFTDPVN